MKKNILFIAGNAFESTRGGVERVTNILADEFEKIGHNVFYLSGVNNYGNIEMSSRQYFFPEKSSKRQYFENEFVTSKNLEFFENFVQEHKITHIIWQDSSQRRAYDFLKIIRKHKIKFITCCHMDPSAWRREKKRWWLRVWNKERKVSKAFRAVFRDVDKYVVLSPRYFPEMQKYLRGNIKKLAAIPNPLTFLPQEEYLTKKKNELLFVGRLENKQKRVNLLLEIWSKIEKNFPDWTLKIVGDGKNRLVLESQAKMLNLQNRVEFFGFQKPELFYRDASIFCMTSAWEGFPMVLNEAAAYACVPVAFDSFAAVRDVITDNENGKLVPAFDLDKYAETLAQLMRERDLRERLAANAQHDVERFSRENIVARWEQLFNELENEKGAPQQ